MHKTRTRFSPSPTGMIHLGNARAALFNALYATQQQGVFILRIEDTDAVRSQEHFVTALEHDLHWLNIDWQEGPQKNGEFGPYWQSQRQEIYIHFYDALEAKKLIYPCFCTDQELNVARKLQLARGQAPRYSGTCLKLSAEDISKRIHSGMKPAWRFKIPVNETVEFIDAVKGPQSFQSNDIGDFIVRRADGTPPFLFCNAIDDATMHVTQVLRGEDHLTNTPRQILILKALELPIPHYGHLSLIVGDDGAPLSKRHGSFSIEEMRNQGFLPKALINYLVRLGHTLELHELATFDLLAQYFDINKLSRSPARFDKTQLMYWQKLAVQDLDKQAMWQWLGEHIQNQIPADQQDLFIETVKANIEFPQDASMWSKIFFHQDVDYDEDAVKIILNAGEQFFVEAEQAVDKYHMDLAQILTEMKATLGISGKKLFMPLRMALTGKDHGPELAAITSILGEKKMKHRLSHAFKVASSKS